MQKNSEGVAVTTLSLPKGGGAIQGMGESLGAMGHDGMASLALPLPISAGRGYAPALSLSYHSGSGNGPFGLGWQVGTPAIRRQTKKGTPTYTAGDIFLTPDGEELVAIRTTQGERQRDQGRLAQAPLAPAETFSVTRYQPRVERDFSRYEYWQPNADDGLSAPFWLIHAADGQLHCLGKSAQARLADPEATTRIAEWLLEESVSPDGQHICYVYRSEDNVGVGADTLEAAQHPQAGAQRYLQRVDYGNREAEPLLYAWSPSSPAPDTWLFSLVLDYGERPAALSEVPGFAAAASWPMRADPFSAYRYGFEVRTRRLCRQVMMFHRLAALAGQGAAQETPALVKTLRLDYAEDTRLSRLVAVRICSYEADGALCSLPPLELGYQPFEPALGRPWQPLTRLTGLNDQQHYQLVDLYGEGMPGVLYQDAHGWQYRPPVRATVPEQGNAMIDAVTDAVTYGPAQRLPTIPALRDSAALMDFTGDGYLDWVVTGAGVAGYYTGNPGAQWGRFTPLSALPTEFFHPRAQWVDLQGAGLADLVLIGPRSVRLYANQRTGFGAVQDVAHAHGNALPCGTIGATDLIAFSDMLGSGQQHLVRIRHDGVTCWPNLGQGRMAEAISLPGFSQPRATFSPDRVHLADLDGSGTTDVLYVESDQVLIYLNQSGNSFLSPLSLPLPPGVRFDTHCQLTLADIQGLGVASLVLSVPTSAGMRHWHCALSPVKPDLLNTANNNMGAVHRLRYRSSAQFWLDEKARATPEGTPLRCQLPMPVHVLMQTQTLDEITGNHLSRRAVYFRGFYHRQEREFRGFGRVETYDTDTAAQGTGEAVAAPMLTRSWFHCGTPESEGLAQLEGWQGDADAFVLRPTRLTQIEQERDRSLPSPVNGGQDETAVYRALRGYPLRAEIYGQDDSVLRAQPYSVVTHRYQVRVLQRSQNGTPLVVLPLTLEQLSYQYERLAADPQCSQRLELDYDVWGYPLRSVTVNYPRRTAAAPAHLCPASLTTDSWAQTYDEQQRVLHIAEQQHSWHHLCENGQWRLGLPRAQRNDVISLLAEAVPVGGFWTESLDLSGILEERANRQFAGQQEVFYTDAQATMPLSSPTMQALVAYTETAELDAPALRAFEGVLAKDALNGQLTQAGYLLRPRLFPKGLEEPVWCIHAGLTDYGGREQFWHPVSQRRSPLSGAVILTWDPTHCMMLQTQDAAGLTMQAQYDPRFLMPCRLTDVNDNVSVCTFDALGRTTSHRFWGTESGEMTGFPTPEAQPFTPPATVAEALAMTASLPVAQYLVYAPFSWMQQTAERHPPHVMTVIADRYWSDPEQQQQQHILCGDGFGRVLQSAQRVEAGLAAQRTASGGLQLNAAGRLRLEPASSRWSISGRVEYDNKGQVVRGYQPYFLDDWRYVSNDNGRENLFADTHVYDPVGREIAVHTAAGYLRRTNYFPWCVIHEDENDTAALLKNENQSAH